MHKYQEAFDFIVTATNGGDGIKKELNILSELVDKETPMKPEKAKPLKEDVRIGNGIFGKGTTIITKCPRCGYWVRKTMKYCNDCGKKLDWEEK